MQRLTYWFVLWTLLGSSASVMANDAVRVGLVLGGGGARGAAHIGVLQVLAEQRIQVACVTGTSMGALVAGAYANGTSATEMAQAMANANWRDMFNDSPAATELHPRTRNVSRAFLPGGEFGVTDKGPVALPSAISGQKIKLFFNQLIHNERGDPRIESLRMPVSLIATDLVSGDKLSFRQGSLSHAMRASMSVPGLMSPVNHGNTRLVDGGLVDNVPIGEVKALCQPDVVIAVNVGSPLFKAEEIDSLLSVAGQMVNILTEQNVTRSLALLRTGDIYIKPNLDGISAGDFEKHEEAIARGRQAAEQVIASLAKLSSAPPSYAAWWASIQNEQRQALRIDAVEIAPTQRVNADVLTQRFAHHVGQVVNTQAIDQDVMRTYGQGDFEAVDYSLLSVRGKNILRITPTEKALGPDFLRTGFNLDSTVGKSATYNIRAAYHKTWVNPLGGEWLSGAQVGNTPKLFTEWYQPLEATRTWFMQTGITYQRNPFSIYQDNHSLSSFHVNETRYELMAGANLGTLGQIQAGRIERTTRVEPDSGNYSLSNERKRTGGWAARLDLDQFDRLFVPSKGWAVRSHYMANHEQGYAKNDVDIRVAQSWQPYVVHGRWFKARPASGELPIYDAYALGGFMNLSGFASNQIIGQSVDYASVRFERILTSLPLGLRGDMRAGIALEQGRVQKRYTETNLDGVLHSVATYIGGETPLGPLYFGIGKAPRGMLNMYLFLGTP